LSAKGLPKLKKAANTLKAFPDIAIITPEGLKMQGRQAITQALGCQFCGVFIIGRQNTIPFAKKSRPCLAEAGAAYMQAGANPCCLQLRLGAFST
jgi:hypothetical protein